MFKRKLELELLVNFLYSIYRFSYNSFFSESFSIVSLSLEKCDIKYLKKNFLIKMKNHLTHICNSITQVKIINYGMFYDFEKWLK